MKAINNPEFILINKIKMIKDKYNNDIPEIAELEKDVLDIINQNCIVSVQMAMEKKIKDILRSALGDKC